MPSVNALSGEAKEVARKKKDDDSPPSQRFGVSLPHDVVDFIESTWRHAELLDGSPCKNVSQFFADVMRREMSRRSNATKVSSKRS